MIFTFYSYKGGVGRSMTLANVAQLFYEAGLKVLMVDWDLEAPGLERFFVNNVEKIHDNPGLIDMLLAYKQRMSQQPLEREKNVLPFEKEKLDSYIVDVSPEIYGEGRILLLPAGKRPAEHFAEYASSVLTFDWDDFYRSWEGELFFEWLRQQLEEMADVILIDSRTGVTEMGGVCTYQLADVIVMLCTTSQQSLDGTCKMARNFTHQEVSKARRGRPISLLIIPARIERAESELLDNFKKDFLEMFREFEPPTKEIDVNTLWQLGIPYIPKYAFAETIAVRESNRASAEDIAATFCQLSEVMGRLRLSQMVLTKPRQVARELALALAKVNQEDAVEVTKLSSLVESFSGPMSEFPELLSYSRGLAHLAHGDEESALTQFRKTSRRGQQVQVEGVLLAIPEKVRRQLDGEFEVFISHDRRDAGWVKELVRRFNAGAHALAPFILPQLVPSAFVAPSDTLARLEGLLLHDDPTRANSVVALVGPGGIGKSALACHFAALHKENFPDGVIGLRVDGKDVDVVAREFARHVSVEVEENDERAADTLMTEIFGHRRMLLIIDGAEDASILSLLPRDSRCSIIVTSRDRQLPFLLAIPEEGQIALSPLSHDDALLLLERLLGKARVAANRESADEIIRLTDGLPLALQIVGASLQVQEWRELDDYVSSLRAERERLTKFQVRGTAQLDMRASFSLNLRLLSNDEVDFFACLSVCAQDGFSIRAATAAAGCDEETANEHLGNLFRLSLVNLHQANTGRFVLHPLTRLFAHELATERTLRDVAAERHARYFVELVKNRETDASLLAEDLDDIIIAAEWLLQHETADSQFISLLQSLLQQHGHWQKTTDLISGFIHLIEKTGEWELAAQLRIRQAAYLSLRGELIRAEETLRPVGDVIRAIASESERQRYEALWLNTLGEILSRQGRYDRAVQALTRSASIEAILGKTSEHASVLSSLGGVLQRQGRYEEAVEALQRSASIEKELGNVKGEAIVLNSLGAVLQRQGRFGEAAETLQRCLILFEELEDQRGLSTTLNDLGGILQRQGLFGEAEVAFRRCSYIYRELNDQRGQAMVLNNLGGLLQRQGRLEEAATAITTSYELCLSLADRRGQAMTLNSLGGVLQRMGQFDEAVEVFQRSAVLEEELDNLRGQAMVLNSLGGVLQRQGRYEEAAEALRRCAAIEEDLGNTRGQAMALNSLGAVLQRQGRIAEALEALRQSYDLAESLGDQTILAMILNSLGGALQRQGQFAEAADIFRRSIQLEEGSGNNRHLALALSSLGSALEKQGRHEEALNALQRSVALYEQIGDRKALAMTLIKLGRAQQRQELFGEALKTYRQSLDVSRKLGDERRVAAAHVASGHSLLALGDVQGAITELKRGFKVEEKLKNQRGILAVAPVLVKNLAESGMREQAVEYYRRSLSIAPDNERLLALNKQFSLSENPSADNLVNGVVKAVIKHQRGYVYGFVSPNDGGPDIYFSQRSVQNALPKLTKGTKVEVEIEQGSKGPIARSVRVRV